MIIHPSMDEITAGILRKLGESSRAPSKGPITIVIRTGGPMSPAERERFGALMIAELRRHPFPNDLKDYEKSERLAARIRGGVPPTDMKPFHAAYFKKLRRFLDWPQ